MWWWLAVEAPFWVPESGNSIRGSIIQTGITILVSYWICGPRRTLENLKVQNLKVQNLKVQNPKVQNPKVQNPEVQNPKPRVVEGCSQPPTTGLRLRAWFGRQGSHANVVMARRWGTFLASWERELYQKFDHQNGDHHTMGSPELSKIWKFKIRKFKIRKPEWSRAAASPRQLGAWFGCQGSHANVVMARRWGNFLASWEREFHQKFDHQNGDYHTVGPTELSKIWKFKIWKFKIWKFKIWKFKIQKFKIRRFKIRRFKIRKFKIRKSKIRKSIIRTPEWSRAAPSPRQLGWERRAWFGRQGGHANVVMARRWGTFLASWGREIHQEFDHQNEDCHTMGHPELSEMNLKVQNLKVQNPKARVVEGSAGPSPRQLGACFGRQGSHANVVMVRRWDTFSDSWGRELYQEFDHQNGDHHIVSPPKISKIWKFKIWKFKIRKLEWSKAGLSNLRRIAAGGLRASESNWNWSTVTGLTAELSGFELSDFEFSDFRELWSPRSVAIPVLMIGIPHRFLASGGPKRCTN
jgi:hypothetical protein